MKPLVIFCGLILLTGCCEMVANPPPYALSLKNGTTNMLVQAGIKFEGYRFDWGNFSPGRSKSDQMVNNPIPSKAVVFWKDQDGKQYNKEVLVKDSLPKDFRGEIVFTIKEGQVDVTHQPFFEMPKNWKVVPK